MNAVEVQTARPNGRDFPFAEPSSMGIRILFRDAAHAPKDLEAWWDDLEPQLEDALRRYCADPALPTALAGATEDMFVTVPTPKSVLKDADDNLVAMLIAAIKEEAIIAIHRYRGESDPRGIF